jgi:hypothetical protein
LRTYEKKGWLHLIHEPSDTYEQGLWVTRMARLAATAFGADWLIHGDDDEFWWPLEGNLKQTFERLPPQVNVVQAQRHNFVYRTKPWYRRRFSFLDLTYCEVHSQNILGQPLPPKVAHRGDPAISIPTGNHRVENINICRTDAPVAEIFHYPIRSKIQLQNKILTGCKAVVENADKHPGAILGTWKHLYEEALIKGNFDAMLDAHTYDRKRIQLELKSGQLRRDPRLRDYFRQRRDALVPATLL